MELFWHATTEVMQIALAVRVVDFHLNYHQPQQWCIYATNTSDAMDFGSIFGTIISEALMLWSDSI